MAKERIYDIAGTHFATVKGAAVTTANAPEFTQALWAAPCDCDVVSVKLYFDASVTANATNYRVLTLQNAGTTGTGTTAVATKSFASGNATALVAMDISPATPVAFAEGDVLKLLNTPVAGGVVLPAVTYVIGFRAKGG